MAHTKEDIAYAQKATLALGAGAGVLSALYTSAAIAMTTPGQQFGPLVATGAAAGIVVPLVGVGLTAIASAKGSWPYKSVHGVMFMAAVAGMTGSVIENKLRQNKSEIVKNNTIMLHDAAPQVSRYDAGNTYVYR